jgi:hypothetical protein
MSLQNEIINWKSLIGGEYIIYLYIYSLICIFFHYSQLNHRNQTKIKLKITSLLFEI